MNELNYKKTEIGLVAKDWTTHFLGDKIKLLTDYHANGSYGILKKNVTLLDYPEYSIMIRTTNLENNDFINNLKYINKHAYEFLSKSKVYADDILMNKIASAGSVYIMPDLDRPVSLAMNLFLIRMDDSVNKKYTYYYLKYIEKFIKKVCSGTATKTITKNEVRKLLLYLPNISEQNKIVSILSTVDDLIENTDHLINSYTLLKKGLMRTLFTKGIGHTEFKETSIGYIPKDWTLFKFPEVVYFQEGPGIRHYQYANKGIPFLNIRCIEDMKIVKDGIQYIKENEVINKYNHFLLNEGDIVVTSSGTLGRVAIIHKEDLPLLLNTSIIRMKSLNENILLNSFLLYYSQSDYYQKRVKFLSTGSAQANYGPSHLKKINMPLPNIHEQRKISSILIYVDDLINISKFKNNQLKELKKGLMQQLLTGKIRVKV